MKLGRATASGMVAVMCLSSASDAIACGDKFLRPGRSSRQARYAAAYPASIVLVKSARSSASGLNDWQKMLKKAGHRSLVVDGGQGLSSALAGQSYDLVIADYNELAGLGSALQAAATKPGLLPVLNESMTKMEAQARAEYHSVIIPSMITPVEALREIDRLMEFRQKNTTTARAR